MRRWGKEVFSMCTVNDAANFFVGICGHGEACAMTNMRVNKLLYFAQVWTLARLGRPLFDAQFEAWPHGPVVPAVYRKYQYCGRNNIGVVDEGYSSEKAFDSDEFDLLIDVYNKYRIYSTEGLLSLSHLKDAPWRAAYSRGRGTVIPRESIKAWFEAQEPLPRPDFSDDNVYKPKLNADGVPILPAEWDDGWEWDNGWVRSDGRA